jgi:hypothetical protein
MKSHRSNCDLQPYVRLLPWCLILGYDFADRASHPVCGLVRIRKSAVAVDNVLVFTLLSPSVAKAQFYDLASILGEDCEQLSSISGLSPV